MGRGSVSAPEEKQIGCERLLATILPAVARHSRQLWLLFLPCLEKTTGFEKLLATFLLKRPSKKNAGDSAEKPTRRGIVLQRLEVPPLNPAELEKED